MKKIIKITLIMLLTLGLNLNVYAVEEDKDTDVTEPVGGETEEKSSDNKLISVTINGQTVVADDTNQIQVEVDSETTKAAITYNLSSDKASIKEGLKEVTLENNETSVKVTIEAEDGKTRDYTIIITKKAKSSDATLKKLTINGEAVTLKSGVTRYDATVSYSATKLEVEAIPNDSKSKIENAKNNKLTYDMTEDSKEIRIKVIPESGDVITYVITVTKRDEEDTTLRDLKIENYDIDFSKEVTDYEITVLKNVDKLEVTATPTDNDATVKVDMPNTLEIGSNTITITVTNDGNTKVYTVKVNKLEQEDKSLANLKSLKIKGYDLDFKEDKYEYDLKIGDINVLDITYDTVNPDATVVVTGNMDLENGSIVKVRVTYTSGLTNVYRINIIKDEVVKKENNVSKIIIVVVIVLIIIAAIVLLIIQLKNKKNNGNKNNSNINKNSNIDKDNNQNVDNETNELNKNFENIGVNTSLDDDDDEIEDII